MISKKLCFTGFLIKLILELLFTGTVFNVVLDDCYIRLDHAGDNGYGTSVGTDVRKHFTAAGHVLYLFFRALL